MLCDGWLVGMDGGWEGGLGERRGGGLGVGMGMGGEGELDWILGLGGIRLAMRARIGDFPGHLEWVWYENMKPRVIVWVM